MKLVGRVLSVASECVPLVKTGGLADVVGALPGALAQHGWEMRVLMPAYRSLRARTADWPVVWVEPELWGGEGRVLAGAVDGVSLLLLDAPHLYDREGGPYSGAAGDWPDNAQRFAALSWVAARIAREGLSDGWSPQVLHVHDWQAGYAPAYLAYGGSGGVGTVLTVHNIAFQGWAPAAMMGDLRLPFEEFHAEGLEYYGGLSSLKAGLVTADRITTVSPTYAAELMRPEFGMGLQGVIAARAHVVSGILNGVDTEVWSPEREVHGFSATAMKGKVLAREALSHRMFAGGDAVLVPSRFEPCGLTQMYGLRYGCLPVVAAVGGLADTVIHANPAAISAGVATGITFHPTDGVAFATAMRQLVSLYGNKVLWVKVQKNAMRQDVGWDRSAAAYAALYAEISG